MIEQCENCYYKGREKCFFHDKKLEEITNCNEGFRDPYERRISQACRDCHYYATDQCIGGIEGSEEYFCML